MGSTDQPEVIPLWPNGVPGSEDWNQQELETFTPQPTSFRTVRNVTQPTLTAVLPHPSRATGTAVIICPGGGFHSLAIDHEGIEVAHWLNTRGVAAFVLKYRLLATEVRDEDFERQFLSGESIRSRQGERRDEADWAAGYCRRTTSHESSTEACFLVGYCSGSDWHLRLLRRRQGHHRCST